MRYSTLSFIAQLNPYAYISKTKREPRFRTLEELSIIYQKATNRQEAFWNKISDFINNEVLEKVTQNQKGEYIIYYTRPNKTTGSSNCYCYKFRNISFGRRNMGWSGEEVSFKTREDKLSFLTANDDAFTLGERFYQLLKFTTGHSQYTAELVFSEVLKTHLESSIGEDKYKLKTGQIITTKIGDFNYYIEYDGRAFKFRGSEKIVNIDLSKKVKKDNELWIPFQ